MQEILDAIQSDASPEDFANLAIPESYRAAHVLRSEQTLSLIHISEPTRPY